jgi:UDP-N-acetylmuramate dehydrogenase
LYDNKCINILNHIIQSNISLKNHNTFGIDATCEAFINIESVDALKSALKNSTLPIQILGGGSNILLLKDHYPRLFIKNSLKGIRIVESSDEYAVVEIGSGESWHGFVMWAVEHNLGGVENLSLIPGTVGASPIQNIGAYGVELKNVFVKLEALNLQTLDCQTFTNEECQFGYRDSIFKRDKKGKYFITKVFLRLTRTHHTLHIEYGDIKKILVEKGIEMPSIRDVSEAVIAIRQSKLPDPEVIGNAGSFFKNPEIAAVDFERLQQDFPQIVGYPAAAENGVKRVKVAAGWLIEQSGWKGKRYGNVGVHERQALVLVNYGKGSGLQIKQLAERIQASVREKFGIELTPEVNMV